MLRAGVFPVRCHLLMCSGIQTDEDTETDDSTRKPHQDTFQDDIIHPPRSRRG